MSGTTFLTERSKKPTYTFKGKIGRCIGQYFAGGMEPDMHTISFLKGLVHGLTMGSYSQKDVQDLERIIAAIEKDRITFDVREEY